MKESLFNPNGSYISRRNFLKKAGFAGFAGTAGLSISPLFFPSSFPAQTMGLPEHPNLLFLITDQQRFPQHWPDGWVEDHLANWNRLAKNGISFSRCYCNTSMCSPSRATLFTGLYPAHHGVLDTLTESDKYEYNDLPLDMQNMARLLKSVGYQVIYQGKWHLSRGAEQYDPSPEEVAAYGFDGWIPPDAGQDGNPENYGARHDARFAEGAAEFLRTQKPEETANRPFALFVSLVNPHDVIGYPRDYEEDYPDIEGLDLGITVPDTINEDLSTKPSVQKALVRMTDLFLGKLTTPKERKTYVNFYAYLHQKVDLEIGKVLDALEDQGLTESTVVFRLADHGEMGLSHGGMRQKTFVMYEEALRVPLLISNPLLFPQAVTSDALASLIDLMPTVAALSHIPVPEGWTFRGQDLTPILTDPSRKVQDTILFTYDDQRAGNEVAGDPMPQPNHIQAIIMDEWKYARYFDPGDASNVEYEMYNLKDDPTEVYNRAGQAGYETQEGELLAHLDAVVAERLAPLPTPSMVNSWKEY